MNFNETGVEIIPCSNLENFKGFIAKYSRVPNKRAARLLNFSDFSFLHALIRDYTIIKIPQKILPTCLFRPTRLFFSASLYS